jgi:3-oxosteroid 1-dehydrogenase
MLLRIFGRTLRDTLLGRQYTTAGAALQGRMLKAALAAGVDIRLNAPVSQIIIADDAATGVETKRDGKAWRIGARLGILINAGGFSQNQAMRDRYMPGTSVLWSQTPEGDTGDMHQEMERIGGVLAHLDDVLEFAQLFEHLLQAASSLTLSQCWSCC